MTNQEIFNKVYTHLMTQGKKAETFGGQCQYRLTELDGAVLMCAAGCLIADEDYDPGMEKLPSISLRTHKKNWNIPWGVDQEEFVSKLQRIHDSLSVSIWEEQLGDFASNNGLSVPSIEDNGNAD